MLQNTLQHNLKELMPSTKTTATPEHDVLVAAITTLRELLEERTTSKKDEDPHKPGLLLAKILQDLFEEVMPSFNAHFDTHFVNAKFDAAKAGTLVITISDKDIS